MWDVPVVEFIQTLQVTWVEKNHNLFCTLYNTVYTDTRWPSTLKSLYYKLLNISTTM